MEQTFNTRVIILDKKDFREADSRIIVFSEDFGKMSLVIRGGKKIKSKLSGHTEPLTLSRLMVVRGRDFDYAGSARGENFYSSVKENLDKIFIAGKALFLVNKATREGEVHEQKEIFILLENFLNNLAVETNKDGNQFEIFSNNLSDVLGFSRQDFEELTK